MRSAAYCFLLHFYDTNMTENETNEIFLPPNQKNRSTEEYYDAKILISAFNCHLHDKLAYKYRASQDMHIFITAYRCIHTKWISPKRSEHSREYRHLRCHFYIAVKYCLSISSVLLYPKTLSVQLVIF